MLIRIHPQNPQPRLIAQVVECLRKGGVIIYPTDTVYGMGCDIRQPRAIEKICRIKKIDPEKALFSFVCSDLSHISDFARVENFAYRIMKKALPGPFTFILNASHEVPKILRGKRKTVGIRVPDLPLVIQLVEQLGNPILSTSLHDDDEILEYFTDPELIHEKYENIADMVIDGGPGGLIPSTIVDCTGQEALLVREGAGDPTLVM